MPRAADVLAALLKRHAVSRVFCVPGESYLSVLDALRDGPTEVIACRHEAGAANMAEAHAKLTGEVGVCLVTRGPGATHASVGVHTARQDSTPMILFIGQVARADKDREAFQEIDYAQFFGPITKWAAELPSAERMEEYVSRAFAVAQSGRPGPVALALPEDLLEEEAPEVAAVAPPASLPAPPAAFLETLRARLGGARRPLLVLGGSGWTAKACAEVQSFAEANRLPVALSFRRKHLLDNESSAYVGDLGLGPNPRLLQAVREADLLLAIGARLGENPTQGYTLLSRQDALAKLVHVHPGAEELLKVWPAALSLPLAPAALAPALAEMRLQAGPWSDWAAELRASYEAFSAPLETAGALNLSQVFTHLREALPADAIVCNGAGNYAGWLHRFYRHRHFGTQLAPTSGAMGYGLPAAIAAKLAAPERAVVAVAGDGCFLMAANELATAAQYGVAVVVLVVDNGGYGTIRMHQARRFPGRVSATLLQNPDFVALARAFGALAWRVERSEDFPLALAEAKSSGQLSLIHLQVELEDIAPGQRLSRLERPAAN